MPGSRAARAQASTIGVALILGLTISIAVGVVALGSTALTDTEQRSQTQQAEQALTQFDSVASQVALGDTDSQQINLGPQAGNYNIREGAGTMKIIHVNFDGTTCDDTDDGELGDPDTSDSCADDDHVIHEQDLGAVEYQRGDTTLAYQGGGVWRLGNGQARMVSPPEFHYRAATLTFPVVTVTGDGSGAGGTTASIVAKKKGVSQFPASCDKPRCGYPSTDNGSDTVSGSVPGDGWPDTPDGDDDGGQYTNPVQNGFIKIQITSKYAAAWEQYFRTRTEGTVSRSGDTVTVKLISLGGIGDFAMPPEGTPLPARGISQSSEHPMQEFEVTLGDKDGTSQNLNNAFWSLYTTSDSGAKKLEFHVQTDAKCKSNDFLKGGNDGTVNLAIFYENTDTGAHEEWVSKDINPDTSSAVDVDCTGEATMTIDWMDTTDLHYEEVDKVVSVGGNNDKFHFEDAVKDSEVDSITLDDHGVDTGNVATDGDNDPNGPSRSLDYLTDHYVGKMDGDLELQVAMGPNTKKNDPIDYRDSFGTFKYDLATSPKYVTFVHVSENEIEVTFD